MLKRLSYAAFSLIGYSHCQKKKHVQTQPNIPSPNKNQLIRPTDRISSYLTCKQVFFILNMTTTIEILLSLSVPHSVLSCETNILQYDGLTDFKLLIQALKHMAENRIITKLCWNCCLKCEVYTVFNYTFVLLVPFASIPGLHRASWSPFISLWAGWYI